MEEATAVAWAEDWEVLEEAAAARRPAVRVGRGAQICSQILSLPPLTLIPPRLTRLGGSKPCYWTCSLCPWESETVLVASQM